MAMQAQRASGNGQGGRGSPNKGEISAFKARLKALPLETLKEKLVGPALGKKWQRELAEDELDAREEDEEEEAVAPVAQRRRGVPLWGWLVALTLIGVSIAIVVYTGYLVLEM